MVFCVVVVLPRIAPRMLVMAVPAVDEDEEEDDVDAEEDEDDEDIMVEQLLRTTSPHTSADAIDKNFLFIFIDL